MSTITKSIDVNIPVRTAYDQWTQFEAFPQFMEGVEEVKQLDDTHLHWKAKVGGHEAEWDAVITEQNPDERVAWRSTDGKQNAGVVTFHRLGEDQTRVTVQMEYEPEGIAENVGGKLGFDDRRVQGDLERFKEFIEARGAPTGAWRGQVNQTHTS
ncbi:MAG TPA: SRPBCC family protein [Chloroflexota bacterium]